MCRGRLARDRDFSAAKATRPVRQGRAEAGFWIWDHGAPVLDPQGIRYDE
jgi:hypothetical protein